MVNTFTNVTRRPKLTCVRLDINTRAELSESKFKLVRPLPLLISLYKAPHAEIDIYVRLYMLMEVGDGAPAATALIQPARLSYAARCLNDQAVGL